MKKLPLFLVFGALAVVSPASISSACSDHHASKSADWDPLFTENVQPSKGDLKLANGLIAADFDLQDLSTREPASTKQRKSTWPAAASEGFEFRVRNKSQVSSMWVMKRGTSYDLVFATSGGSRVSLSIPPEQFHALKDQASQMRAPASDMKKCQDSNVQLKVVSIDSPNNVSACLNAKGRAADQLRLFSATLSTFVR